MYGQDEYALSQNTWKLLPWSGEFENFHTYEWPLVWRVVEPYKPRILNLVEAVFPRADHIKVYVLMLRTVAWGKAESIIYAEEGDKRFDEAVAMLAMAGRLLDFIDTHCLVEARTAENYRRYVRRPY